MRDRAAVSRYGRHAALLAATAVMLLPFVWMLAVSFSSPGDLFSGGLWPAMTLEGARKNYAFALSQVPLPRYVLNGVIVCSAIFVLQVLIAAPAGYALAKLPFRGRRLLFSAVLVGLLIPSQVPAIPL
jgi:multiple sugar transport system permease protein